MYSFLMQFFIKQEFSRLVCRFSQTNRAFGQFLHPQLSETLKFVEWVSSKFIEFNIHFDNEYLNSKFSQVKQLLM